MKESERDILQRFEEFLASIPLERYREELLPVKTVEQDLPRSLNPLPAIYEAYWSDNPQKFPTYEQFFNSWWESNLVALDDFVRKYFWGCSWEFVRKGFKARLYRTVVSVLTQFHFRYSWKAYCEASLEASSELDTAGVDAEVNVAGTRAALQVKKETYRAEAGGEGRFARRKHPYPLVVEVPYTLTLPEEWQRRAERARSSTRASQARLFHFCALRLQRWLPNGFVVFKPEYPIAVERYIHEHLAESGYHGWQQVVHGIMTRNWGEE